MHARVLLLDCGARVALVSVELTSLPAERVAALRAIVGQVAGLPALNVWVCVTHTMSAPHFVPEDRCETPADQQKNVCLWGAVEAAVSDAATQAIARLEEVRLGYKSGPCEVNVNRDVPTAEGWWLGCNESGFSDKTLTVLRFETAGGHPLAVLFNYCVRPSVMERPPGSESAGFVTADLAGAACGLVEQEYGEGTTALFFMGAAGDQAPTITGARFQYVGRGGSARVKEGGEDGHAVAEMIGARLGAEVLRLSEEMECEVWSDPLVGDRAEVAFKGQQMPGTSSIRPTTRYDFAPGVDRVETIGIIRSGELARVGVGPELSCHTGVVIREQSPFSPTLVLTMVNGGFKNMADDSAYERVTYEAMNSPFARGSAESLVQAVSGILRRVAG